MKFSGYLQNRHLHDMTEDRHQKFAYRRVPEQNGEWKRFSLLSFEEKVQKVKQKMVCHANEDFCNAMPPVWEGGALSASQRDLLKCIFHCNIAATVRRWPFAAKNLPEVLE